MASPPFKVKAVYEYASEHEEDLSFPVGQLITVVELEGDDWYVGEYTDVTGSKHEGMFPANFVEKYEPEVPTRPTRPARAKQEAPQPVAAPAPEAPAERELPAPAMSSVSKATESAPSSMETEARSPPPASSQPQPAIARQEPPAAPKPAPAPAESAESASTPAKKAPPPVATKSNAFKDRIAAFNQTAAAPIAPMQPGGKPPPSTGFIKKPFVAPPPSKNAYIPPPKAEPVQRTYVREEDPEIRQRQEEDRAAAEAAGLASESSAAPEAAEDEDAPKPLTLKERMALLQKQQQEQAQRRAETSQKKEKKMPQKQLSGSSETAAPEADDGELERVKSDSTERQSLDTSRDRRRVPSAQRIPAEPLSPRPVPPDHEILSDGHEADQSGAGEMTEDDTATLGPDESDDLRHPAAPKAEADVGDEDDTTEGHDEEEDEGEDEVDEETRRKEELRARMARLGGGMPGMGSPFNPFGAPAPTPPRRKPQTSNDRNAGESTTSGTSQPIPMVPVPGMQRMQSPEADTRQRLGDNQEGADDEDEEDTATAPAPPRRSATFDRGAPPPVSKDSRPLPPPPQERAVPPPPPGTVSRSATMDSRPVPPPPPSAAPLSPGPLAPESDDDDDASTQTLPIRSGAPPVPTSREVPPRPPPSTRTSQYGTGEASDRRSSRVPPPVPGDSLAQSSRPPPPPPPAQVQSPLDANDHERAGSDYDGDYDTDIASSAKHKDALRAPHHRESSLTDSTLADEASMNSPTSAPPPAPLPRAVPPPPPEAPQRTRTSMDRPPPPVPGAREDLNEEDYDPYRYPKDRAAAANAGTAPTSVPPVPPSQMVEDSSDDETHAPPSPPRRSIDRAPPPPPPQERAVPAPPETLQAPSRASTDILRTVNPGRRSIEQAGPSGEHGQMASEMDLPTSPSWWIAEQPLPPALQSRNGVDILSECEETSKSKRGGRKEITKDIYILYMDYSQTVISARYDSQDPAEVHFEQRHEPPPPKLRQDQLEAAWQRFGTKIADAAGQVGHSKKDSVVGDGSPSSLPLSLIKAHQDALLPVGMRAYGALVYANLANASTMQFDEIRRGDIITVRNAKFEGHHGAMKTKYKSDYGPSHVAVVEEWDGTRRAVRAWEQGREKKGGVRSEKFRLGDLRSGEVRVWRVVGRDWVGWDSS